MMTRVSQLWDLIDTWGFREDIKDIVANNADDNDDDDNNNNNKDDNNDKDGNNDKGISALGLDRHGVFARTSRTSLPTTPITPLTLDPPDPRLAEADPCGAARILGEHSDLKF